VCVCVCVCVCRGELCVWLVGWLVFGFVSFVLGQILKSKWKVMWENDRNNLRNDSFSPMPSVL